MKKLMHSISMGILVLELAAGGFSARADIDLNGNWEFCFVDGKSIETAGGADFAANETMVVPGCYDMMSNHLCARGTGLYRRTFTLASPVTNAWLDIDGMGLRGKFSIDGRDLGIHPYPYARLRLATGPLSAGKHTVFAALDNRFDWSTMKLARPYYDFYCYGGFYHGVKLVFEGRRLLVRTLDYTTGMVEIEIAGDDSQHEKGSVGRTIVFDDAHSMPVVFRNGIATARVPNFKLWSPQHPALHKVSVDGVSARFGIRTVSVRNRQLYLNGERLYLKGANRHEAHPTFGAATPSALMLLDIQNLKAMGGNFFRGCHYQQCETFLDLCDREGILVWEESLGWGNGSHSVMATCELTNETFRAQQIHQTREMVRTSMNHPSVIISAFMNEFLSGSEAGRTLADELIRTIRAERSGHLVTFACSHIEKDISCTNVDVIAFNTYPGWIGSQPGTPEQLATSISNKVDEIVRLFRSRHPDKPIMVSEMGACGIYGHHDPAGAQWTEEFQAEYFDDICTAVLPRNDMVGLTLWQFTDARSYHRDGATVRSKPLAENLGGLFDGYRRPKLAAKVVAQDFKRLGVPQNANAE